MKGTTLFKALVGLAGIVACASACTDANNEETQPAKFSREYPFSTVIRPNETEKTQAAPSLSDNVSKYEVISSKESDPSTAVHTIDAVVEPADNIPDNPRLLPPAYDNVSLNIEAQHLRANMLVRSEKNMNVLRTDTIAHLKLGALTPYELTKYIVAVVGVNKLDSEWPSTRDSDKITVASYIIGSLFMDNKTELQLKKGLNGDYYVTTGTPLTVFQQIDIRSFEELEQGLDAYLKEIITGRIDKAEFNIHVHMYFNTIRVQEKLVYVDESRREDLTGYLTGTFLEKYKDKVLDNATGLRLRAIH